MQFCLDIWGDYACFTRPETKVERVSYDVITPSSARSIFEAILWKPEIKWQVLKIEVLNPVSWIGVRRNELEGVVTTNKISGYQKKGRGNFSKIIEDNRQQRASLILRDVHYRIYATFKVLSPNDRNTYAKYAEMFVRRAKRGQCINQPYLGCREFACYFEYCEDPEKEKPPIKEDRDLGLMLYDIDFSDKKNYQPMFFRAQMHHGVIDIPNPKSAEVIK